MCNFRQKLEIDLVIEIHFFKMYVYFLTSAWGSFKIRSLEEAIEGGAYSREPPLI